MGVSPIPLFEEHHWHGGYAFLRYADGITLATLEAFVSIFIKFDIPDPENLEKDAEVLRRSGYNVMTKTVDAFGPVMANGGAGLVISSQAGHMMPMSHETEQQLATVPAEQLTELDIVKQTAMERSGNAYMVAKRCNHLRVRTAAATTWGDRGARINTISPGIIVTPLAYDEFHADGAGYQAMIDASPAKRVGTADEIAELGAFLLSDRTSFITGTDILIDGGVIAAMNSGRFGLTGNR